MHKTSLIYILFRWKTSCMSKLILFPMAALSHTICNFWGQICEELCPREHRVTIQPCQFGFTRPLNELHFGKIPRNWMQNFVIYTSENMKLLLQCQFTYDLLLLQFDNGFFWVQKCFQTFNYGNDLITMQSHFVSCIMQNKLSLTLPFKIFAHIVWHESN